MRMKLVVIGVVLILLSAIIFATMIITEEKVVEEEESTGITAAGDSWMEYSKSLAHPEPEPLPDYIVPGIASFLLLLGGICFLVNAKNEKFLPWIH